MANVKEKETHEKMAPELNVDSSSISTVASMVGMLLTTIALGGMRTYWLAAFAVVAVGIAQLFEGEMLSSRISPLNSRPFRNTSVGMVTGRLPGGIASIVLGVLSLFGVLTRILLPVTSILFGLVLTLGSWAIVRFNDVYTAKACEKDETRAVARAAVRIVGTLDMFIGCGSIALGILALTDIGFVPVPLTLVATFGVGFASLLKSTVFSSRVLNNLHCDKLPAV
ncbi:MAG: hypothetical protein ACXU9K_06375 [Thermodesulfobacteriota bacterium]